jgi:hypothetical protein
LVYYGWLKQMPDWTRVGYLWIFATSGFFLIRLLLDPVMVRRPLLEPNLSTGGLTFTGVALIVFLMANVINNPMTNVSAGPSERLEHLLAKQAAPQRPNPGYAFFYKFSSFSNEAVLRSDASQPAAYREALIHVATSRTVVILSHLAILIGMVWIGFRHFDNIHTGIAAASLYLLTFSTSQFTSQVDHVVPAMLLVWAVAMYRRPITAGVFLGLAAGVIYYPLFLLPLWCGFYWRRGLLRFVVGVLVATVILVISLALNSSDLAAFRSHVEQMFGWRNPFQTVAVGFWQYYESAYRIPVMAAFIGISGSLAIWPAQKNLGTLLSCSAAVMVAAQFWHANYGGLYIAWYLPLLILTIFRPNLEDRVALSTVLPIWRRKRA